jgi:hypothetical protein
MSSSIDKIISYLNENRIRATKSAVADACGVSVRGLSSLMGDRSPEASWVVSGATGHPTGYKREDLHAELYRSSRIITSAEVFRRNLGV